MTKRRLHRPRFSHNYSRPKYDKYNESTIECWRFVNLTLVIPFYLFSPINLENLFRWCFLQQLESASNSQYLVSRRMGNSATGACHSILWYFAAHMAVHLQVKIWESGHKKFTTFVHWWPKTSDFYYIKRKESEEWSSN